MVQGADICNRAVSKFWTPLSSINVLITLTDFQNTGSSLRGWKSTTCCCALRNGTLAWTALMRTSPTDSQDMQFAASCFTSLYARSIAIMMEVQTWVYQSRSVKCVAVARRLEIPVSWEGWFQTCRYMITEVTAHFQAVVSVPTLYSIRT